MRPSEVFAVALALTIAAHLAGCIRRPGPTMPLTPPQSSAVAATRHAWANAGELVAECSQLDRAELILLPPDRLHDECAGVVSACVFGVNVHAFSALRTWFLVDATLDAQGLQIAIVHETLHVLYGCAYGHPDRLHRDADVWGPVQAAALSIQ